MEKCLGLLREISAPRKGWKIKSVLVFPQDQRNQYILWDFSISTEPKRVQNTRDFSKLSFCHQDSSFWISLSGKKIYFETKSQKYSKTTGRDSRSNSFYWSSQARILLLLCSFASWLHYLSTWLKSISFFLTEMHSKL